MSEECIWKDTPLGQHGTAVKPQALDSDSLPSLSYLHHLDSTRVKLSVLVSALDKDKKNICLQKSPLTELILLHM